MRNTVRLLYVLNGFGLPMTKFEVFKNVYFVGFDVQYQSMVDMFK